MVCALRRSLLFLEDCFPRNGFQTKVRKPLSARILFQLLYSSNPDGHHSVCGQKNIIDLRMKDLLHQKEDEDESEIGSVSKFSRTR